ncbi:hypothetical protein [Undibacterium luofuense]|uniref:hypothetical protein n=1 Tax=Undibacterium luofuense TaxID=2828733 RepID=UPI0030EBF9D3
MSDYSQHEINTLRQYRKELWSCIAIYMVVLFASIWIAKGITEQVLRTAIVLLPAIPAAGVLWVVIRHLRRMDDYVRLIMLETLAISGGFTALLAFSYGFLEGVGFPRLSGFIYYGIFMGSWLVISMFRKFRGEV